MQWRLAVALRLIEASGLALDRPLRALDIGGGAGRFRDQIERATRVARGHDRLPPPRPAHGAARARTDSRRRRHAGGPAAPRLVRRRLRLRRDRAPREPGAAPPRGRSRTFGPAATCSSTCRPCQALYSAYDVVQGHVRRYSTAHARGAARPVSRAGWKSASYWGLSLVPLLGLRRLRVGRTPGPRTYRVGLPAAGHGSSTRP